MEDLELKDQIQRPREITFKTFAMTDKEIIKILKFIHKCPISIKKECFIETWENEKRTIDLTPLKK